MLLPVEPEVVPLLVPEGSVVPGVLGLSVSGLSVSGLSVPGLSVSGLSVPGLSVSDRVQGYGQRREYSVSEDADQYF